MSVAAPTVIDCAARPVDAALWLARAFTAGRALMVRAPGCEDHAHHVAVEFVHPVVAGARSLPAVAAVEGSSAAGSGPFAPNSNPFGTDAVEGSPAASPRPFAASPDPFYAGTGGRWCHLLIGAPDGGHFDLVIPTDGGDAATMTGYHLLWELVQVALEHPGLVGGSDASGGDSTGFLYPFLDAAESDEASLREALEASAAAKRAASERLAAEAVAANRPALEAAAALVGEAVAAGRRVLVMGNGGSAADAARLARLLRARGADAASLAGDYAVVSALANDLGAEAVFARQLDALGGPGDILIGCSTSGASPNLLTAFDRAAAMGMRTVGISGYGGGAFAGRAGVEVALSVASDSVHRIQEAEAALIAEMCRLIGPGSP